MSHRKRDKNGKKLPKSSATNRTRTRWDQRVYCIMPKESGFKPFVPTKLKISDDDDAGFKSMKKVKL